MGRLGLRNTTIKQQNTVAEVAAAVQRLRRRRRRQQRSGSGSGSGIGSGSGGDGSSGGRSGSGSAAQRRQWQRISGNSANDFFSDQGFVSNFFSDYYGSDSDSSEHLPCYLFFSQ